MAGTNSVLNNDTSIVLDWADVSGADQYHIQVSPTPDFSGTLEVDDNSLGVSTKSYTDSGTNDTKRWWRWRHSTDSGTTWNEWNEVGSFWINTGASDDITLATEKWALIDPDAVSDNYILDLFPFYSVIPFHFNRIRERNRQGTILSEFVTLKDRIIFNFDENSYIEHKQMREFRRFNSEHKTFFLATYKNNAQDNVQNIWKVQFDGSPAFTMIAHGREDLFIGELIFEEV